MRIRIMYTVVVAVVLLTACGGPAPTGVIESPIQVPTTPPPPTSEPTQPEAQPNEQAYPLPLPTTPTCKPPDGSERQPFDKTSIDMLNTDSGEVETIWAFVLRDGQAVFKMPEGGVVIMDPGHSLTIEAGGQFLVLFIGCDKYLWIGEYSEPPPDLVPQERNQG